MVKLLEFLARHTARHLFRSSHLKPFRGAEAKVRENLRGGIPPERQKI